MPCKCRDTEQGVISISGDGRTITKTLPSPICYNITPVDVCGSVDVYWRGKSWYHNSTIPGGKRENRDGNRVRVWGPVGGSLRREADEIELYDAYGQPYKNWFVREYLWCSGERPVTGLNNPWAGPCKEYGEYQIYVANNQYNYYEPIIGSEEIYRIDTNGSGNPTYLLSVNAGAYSLNKYFNKVPTVKVKCGCSKNECECQHQGFTCCIDPRSGKSRRI